MSAKVGVLLSGCGFLDGAEVHEAVLTLLALDQLGATTVCCAPNIAQSATIDHLTKKPTSERRNVLTESARIARGAIRDVAQVKAADLDALILPGGFGAAKNLCDFAEKGPACSVNPAVERLVGDMLEERKPVGAICIAPGLLARVAGARSMKAKLTIGTDQATAAAIIALGCAHESRAVTEIALDAEHHIVSTPAYMLGRGPAEVFEGIRKLVDEVLKMAEKQG
ncbi:Enhancing lycopene biosynthesis protein 2 [Phycisphaerae bacterium RAS1]|nr:Enhancing lycopene biosynthesis protein 2 [Phycisphaerae bacterium RAS1]